MISKTTITSSGSAASYHDAALTTDGNLARDADNYYANDRAIATWQGAGAELLGIKGEKVNREDFVNFLEGKLTNPHDGQLQDLAENSKGDSRRLGYDFTISAPKSVSIVGLVGNDQRVVDAHIEANARAMEWLEKHGAQIRVKDEHGNNKIVHTNNLIYATVQHETSRANDPQLHNHNVIIGATYDTEALKWRSLTNDELFQIRTAADSIYKNELAVLLQEAGYELKFDANGMDFAIAGITDEQVAEFSERTRQRNEALLARGISPEHASHRAREAAVLDSRAAKSDLTKDELVSIWREKAAEAKLDVDRIVEKAMSAPRKEVDRDALDRTITKAVNRAIEHLSEREQSFKLSELESEAVFFSGKTASVEQIQNAIAEKMKERTLLTRESDKARYVTTSEAVSQELTLQDNIHRGKGNGIPVLTDIKEFEAAIAKFEARKSIETNSQYKLTAEQRNAAQNILMHSDKYQGVQGDAGTGKTAALEFVKEVATERGWEISGIATSTTAARQLEKDTGIPSATVASFMLHNDKQAQMLKADIDRMAVDIAQKADNSPFVKQVERRDLNLKGDEKGFGAARYVFDNKTGNVFKSNAGPLNVLNRTGHHLTDSGNQKIEGAQAAWATAETFSSRLSAGAALVRAKAEIGIGRTLAHYQKVGHVEALAAREAHHQLHQKEFNELLHAYNVKQSQLTNLTKTGHVDGKKFLLVMDESSMTGTRDSARLAEMAHELGARIVLQGDIKQHGSVSAGRAFEQTQQGGINLSKIEETRRFDNATQQTKNAIAEMKKGNYATALKGLDTIEVKTSEQIYSTVAERFIANREELKAKGVDAPKVGIVTITNDDRKGINVAVREALRKNGELSGQDFAKQHLDDPKLTAAQRKYVPSLSENGVNRMTALRDYRKLGVKKDDVLKIVAFQPNANTLTAERPDGKQIVIDPGKHQKFDYAVLEDRNYAVGDRVEARANIGKYRDPERVTNGEKGVVTKVDGQGATIKWDGDTNRELTFSNQQMLHVDHAYAHTSYKEQGVTNHREIIAVSEVGAKWFNKLASYVAASRAKDNTEIVTSDRETMLKNAGAEQTKTTAIDIGQKSDALRNNQQQSVARQMQIGSLQEPTKSKETSRELSM